jgi:hypothetical protein
MVTTSKATLLLRSDARVCPGNAGFWFGALGGRGSTPACGVVVVWADALVAIDTTNATIRLFMLATSPRRYSPTFT